MHKVREMPWGEATENGLGIFLKSFANLYISQHPKNSNFNLSLSLSLSLSHASIPKPIMNVIVSDQFDRDLERCLEQLH
jgi:hypothetical protein